MSDTLLYLIGWSIIATLVVGISLTLEFALRGLANRYGTPQRPPALDAPDRPAW